MKIKTIIIDDEPLARARLRRLLGPMEDIDLVGEAGNGEEGLTMIRHHDPDIVFLDIKMPVLTGFEMLRKLEAAPYIIFTTAFDEYALRAFEENTIDYLLKPISEEKLQRALGKVRKVVGESGAFTQSLDTILKTLTNRDRPIRRFSVRIGDRILIVPEEKIVCFQSEDKYTFLHTSEEKYIVPFTLKELEKRLDTEKFIRIHRSVIIQLDHAVSIHRWFRGQLKVKMKNGSEFTVTTKYVGDFKQKIHL